MSEVDNSLHIVLFCTDDGTEFDDISTIVTHLLSTRHHVTAGFITFLPEEILKNYKRKNNTVVRFRLRDDIVLGYLEDKTVYSVKPPSESYPAADGEECVNCFCDTGLPKPLGVETFSLLQEWCLDVPLDLQIFFETFINKESMWHTSDKKSFLYSKIETLYSVYDILLNTFNRNYFGVLQQANTDELAMHYHSISTVFSITRNAGMSASLDAAEKKIKTRTVDDLCYYNTYLKKFPMTYNTSCGQTEKKVSLRDCHLILMIDNLVRISTLTDPFPGTDKTGQICTLPITIQGLPIDSAETDNWHNPEVCDKSQCCPCKYREKLEKRTLNVC